VPVRDPGFARTTSVRSRPSFLFPTYPVSEFCQHEQAVVKRRLWPVDHEPFELLVPLGVAHRDAKITNRRERDAKWVLPIRRKLFPVRLDLALHDFENKGRYLRWIDVRTQSVKIVILLPEWEWWFDSPRPHQIVSGSPIRGPTAIRNAN
jgi:hypothetical protein